MAPIQTDKCYDVRDTTSSVKCSRCKRSCDFLPITRRGRFFQDSFFSDIHKDFDTSIRAVLDRWSEKDLRFRDSWDGDDVRYSDIMGRYRELRSRNLKEENQAVTVTSDSASHKIVLDVHDFMSGDVKVKVLDEEELLVEGHVERKEEGSASVTSHSFRRYFSLPQNADMTSIMSVMSSDGILTITAPKVQQDIAKEKAINETHKSFGSASETQSHMKSNLFSDAHSDALSSRRERLSSLKSEFESSATSDSYRHRRDSWDSFLPITKRGRFFQDSFFSNIHRDFDLSIKKVLEDWNDSDRKRREFWDDDEDHFTDTLGRFRHLRSRGLRKEDQFVTVSSDSSNHKIVLDMYEFIDGEVKLKVVGERELVVEAYSVMASHTFKRHFSLPQNTDMTAITSVMSSDGVLTIVAPQKLDSMAQEKSESSINKLNSESSASSFSTSSALETSTLETDQEKYKHISLDKNSHPRSVNTEYDSEETSSQCNTISSDIKTCEDSAVEVQGQMKIKITTEGRPEPVRQFEVREMQESTSILDSSMAADSSAAQEKVSAHECFVNINQNDSEKVTCQNKTIEVHDTNSPLVIEEVAETETSENRFSTKQSTLTSDELTTEKQFIQELDSEKTNEEANCTASQDVLIDSTDITTAPEEYLEIVRKGGFMKDNFFADVRRDFEVAIRKIMMKWSESDITKDINLSLSEILERYRELRSRDRNEENQAFALTADDTYFKIVLDVEDFMFGDVKVKATNELEILVEGRVDKKDPGTLDVSSRSFRRRFILPENIDVTAVTAAMSSDGILTITALRMQKRNQEVFSIEEIQESSEIENCTSLASEMNDLTTDQELDYARKDTLENRETDAEANSITLSEEVTESHNTLRVTETQISSDSNSDFASGHTDDRLNNEKQLEIDEITDASESSVPEETNETAAEVSHDSSVRRKMIRRGSCNVENMFENLHIARRLSTQESCLTNANEEEAAGKITEILEFDEEEAPSKTNDMLEIGDEEEVTANLELDDEEEIIGKRTDHLEHGDEEEVTENLEFQDEEEITGEMIDSLDIDGEEEVTGKSSENLEINAEEEITGEVVENEGLQKEEKMTGKNTENLQMDDEEKIIVKITDHLENEDEQETTENLTLKVNSEERLKTSSVCDEGDKLQSKAETEIEETSSSCHVLETQNSVENVLSSTETASTLGQTDTESKKRQTEIDENFAASELNVSEEGDGLCHVMKGHLSQQNLMSANETTSASCCSNAETDVGESFVASKVSESKNSMKMDSNNTSVIREEAEKNYVKDSYLFPIREECGEVKESADLGFTRDTTYNISSRNFQEKATDSSIPITRTRHDSLEDSLLITRRGKFFEDSFFSESRADFDAALREVLNKWSATSFKDEDNICYTDVLDHYRKLRMSNLKEDTQAFIVTSDNTCQKIVLDVHDFMRGDVKVKVVEGNLIVEGRIEKSEDGHSTVSSHSFRRIFSLQKYIDLMAITSVLSLDGILTITAPLKNVDNSLNATSKVYKYTSALNKAEKYDNVNDSREVAELTSEKKTSQGSEKGNVFQSVASTSEKKKFASLSQVQNDLTHDTQSSQEKSQPSFGEPIENYTSSRVNRGLYSRICASTKSFPVTKKGLFFHDTFFQDIREEYKKAVREVLTKWGEEAAFGDELTCYRRLRARDLREDNQAVTSTEDERYYKFIIDVHDFVDGGEIIVKAVDDKELVVEGHLKKTEGGSTATKRFVRRFIVPVDILMDAVTSVMSSDGVLTISAPKLETRKYKSKLSELLNDMESETSTKKMLSDNYSWQRKNNFESPSKDCSEGSEVHNSSVNSKFSSIMSDEIQKRKYLENQNNCTTDQHDITTTSSRRFSDEYLKSRDASSDEDDFDVFGTRRSNRYRMSFGDEENDAVLRLNKNAEMSSDYKDYRYKAPTFSTETKFLNIDRKGKFDDEFFFVNVRSSYSQAVKEVLEKANEWSCRSDAMENYRNLRRRNLKLENQARNVSEDHQSHMIVIDVDDFLGGEVTVQLVKGKELVVEGRAERQDGGRVSRLSFVRRFSLPPLIDHDAIACAVSSDGILAIISKKIRNTFSSLEHPSSERSHLGRSWEDKGAKDLEDFRGSGSGSRRFNTGVRSKYQHSYVNNY